MGVEGSYCTVQQNDHIHREKICMNIDGAGKILPHSSLRREGVGECVMGMEGGIRGLTYPFDSTSFFLIIKSFGLIAQILETDRLGLNTGSTTYSVTLGK